ncbi:tyrosine-type recombinase/integrase [Intestinicryptomonas porci]|uniref:Tyrosine-type recombinase/integrase n=1 Tax=Intestinicryptomonas porci TaxID=2926320 RepID=A0ABU4WF70_9BACT|nr:tyrosine-type recombinase/integrase [Opitutales bacterium CLA-KB-P66]
MDTILNSAKKVLGETTVSALDSARFVRNILDAKPSDSKLTDAQFILKVIEVGLRHIRTKEMSFYKGFELYYKTKKDILRPDSLRDIRYLGNRLMRSNPQLANRNFSELSRLDCEDWLNDTFLTPSQFNKGRSFLHAIFEFAIRREWCDKNPIKRIERRKVIEKEIIPLKLSETKRLIQTAQRESHEYAVVAALLIYAGIRPREVRRLSWYDIDTEEKTITVRSQCSKTGGVRHVEIPPILNRILIVNKSENGLPICPTNWQRRWRKIRDNSGFKGLWVQDVLRHTYASYFAKRYSDLPRLQLNMGHRDLSLLRSRYVNMSQISKSDAADFFN